MRRVATLFPPHSSSRRDYRWVRSHTNSRQAALQNLRKIWRTNQSNAERRIYSTPVVLDFISIAPSGKPPHKARTKRTPPGARATGVCRASPGRRSGRRRRTNRIRCTCVRREREVGGIPTPQQLREHSWLGPLEPPCRQPSPDFGASPPMAPARRPGAMLEHAFPPPHE
jgi:hypothetical protein